MINLRQLPPVDEILAEERVQNLLQTYRHDFVIANVRLAVDAVRNEIRNRDEEIDRKAITAIILDRLELFIKNKAAGTLRRVVNGTGVILHTNLGRAPLGARALQQVMDMGSGYCNLEFDLENGERGSRYKHVEDLLIELTGAEAALVVNNNAAAVLLGLNTLAADREVIVSRGQLVEIGGAFRIPEVMQQSGAHLVEVGTTNRTYINDFAQAINSETALLFLAHPSNYKILGFTTEVKLAEMVRLGQQHGLPVMEDLGSGVIYNLEKWGLAEEHVVRDCVAAGADIITFSGDKLLGGPQAGIIVGKKKLIAAMKKNQLTRALRVDKLTIAALEGTLLEYLEVNPEENIPVLQMLTISAEELKLRARELAELLQNTIASLPLILDIAVVEVEDVVGGGTYPTLKLPGYAIEITFADNKLEYITKQLRRQNPALLSRKQEGRMLISVRTLLPGDDILLVRLLRQVAGETALIANPLTNGEK